MVAPALGDDGADGDRARTRLQGERGGDRLRVRAESTDQPTHEPTPLDDGMAALEPNDMRTWLRRPASADHDQDDPEDAQPLHRQQIADALLHTRIARRARPSQ